METTGVLIECHNTQTPCPDCFDMGPFGLRISLADGQNEDDIRQWRKSADVHYFGTVFMNLYLTTTILDTPRFCWIRAQAG